MRRQSVTQSGLRRWARRLRAPWSALLVPLLSPSCTADHEPDGVQDPHAAARRAMVEQQIEARGIRDQRVLRAMREVPRHRFVPRSQRDMAYMDRPLSIGHGQTISQPYIVAFMTEALKLDTGGEDQPPDKVLEIGTGSGYQAAVLAEMGCRVFTIEIVEPLAKEAEQTLEELGYDVAVRAGDGYQGWPGEAPFDAVIVTAAPDHVPQPLVDQLAEGGRMIIPVGDAFQELVLLHKKQGDLVKEEVLPVRFVPMTGEARERDK